MNDTQTPPGLTDQELTETPLTDSSSESAERQLLKRLWRLTAPKESDEVQSEE